MFTQPRLASLFMLAFLASLSVSAVPLAAAEKPANTRIAASFVIALGRAASAEELAAWAARAEQPFTELLARHEQELQQNTARQREVAERAWQDAWGRRPATGAASTAGGTRQTYTSHMQRHVRELGGDVAGYDAVIHRAYQLVVRRDAYPEELDTWRRHGALPFVILVGCVEDWARRNQPGLMVTTGTATLAVNSDYLTTVVLSPELAAELRAASGLMPEGDPALASAAGRNLIAVGAEGVVTGGHLHLVAAGSPHLTENLQP